MSETGCLKDGHFHNLQVENSVIAKKNFMSVNASRTITKNDCGIIFLNGSSTSASDVLAATSTLTLPDAETGLHYKFILNASITSSASFVIDTGTGNGSFVGSINASASIKNASPTHTKIVVDNGSLPGDFVELNCYKDDSVKRWHTFGRTGEVTGASSSGVYFA
jgi:hypothetical protein